MIATLANEGSKSAQEDRNVAFFVVSQGVRGAVSFVLYSILHKV